MRRLTLLLILAGALGGCSSREHANPFDPANPDTGGRPAGFVALAGNATVSLRWSAASAPGLLGYQVFRKLPADSAYSAISGILPPRTTRFDDFGLLNGVDHAYRLYFVLAQGLGTLPAEDVATPGPVVPWITDFTAGTLIQLTADGRHAAFALNPVAGATPAELDLDRSSGALWACDPSFGIVWYYQPRTATLTAIRSGLDTPNAAAVDTVDHSAWIGDTGFSDVERFAPDGSLVSPFVLHNLAGPIGLAVDPRDRALWVCERQGDRVRRIGADTTGFAVGVIAPSRVAVDSATGNAWVTSFNRGTVVAITPAGARVDSMVALVGPVGVAVDARRGRIWIADPDANQVVALRRDASLEFRVAGLPGANDVAVDPATGEAWVALAGNGSVARLSASGRVVRQTGGFLEPYGIRLDISGETGIPQSLTARARPSGSPRPHPGRGE
jgi:DNA-binding beta-propeller fold protein YncE